MNVGFGEGWGRAIISSTHAIQTFHTEGPTPCRRAAKRATPAEKKLWAYLRMMREDGVHFRRQHAIGTYIADFCAPRKKIVIELDGSQHLEQSGYDEERTKYLESQDYKVIRFWNNHVMNDIEGVIKEIMLALETKG